VPPKELYSIECLDDQVPAIKPVSQLPMLAKPICGEALPGWLHRFAGELHLPPSQLLLDAEEGELPSDDTWWRNPPLELVARIAARTGAEVTVLNTMTFGDWEIDRCTDEVMRRFSRGRVRGTLPACVTRRYGVCAMCLATDDVPYVRREWTLGWVVACERHGMRLNETCRYCWQGYMLPFLKHRTDFGVHRCWRLDSALADQPKVPAHPAAQRLQRALFSGRAARSVSLASVGTLSWASAIGLIDSILRTAWTPVDSLLHRRCYQSLAQELDYQGVLKGSCHDGLTIASWVLDDWPGRLLWLTKKLGLPEPEFHKRWSGDKNHCPSLDLG